MGTTSISGSKIEVFLSNDDIKKLADSIGYGGATTTTPTTTTTIPTQTSGFKVTKIIVPAIKEANGGTQKVISWVIEGGSGNYGFKTGSFVGNGNTIWMAPNNVWNIEVFDKSDPSKTVTISVNSLNDGQAGVVNFNNTGGPIETGTTVVIPVVVTQPVVTSTNNNYAELGKEYFSKDRFKLLLPTRENDFQAQIFKASQGGKTIVEYDRHQGWNTESSHSGNHPSEWQPAVNDGQVDFYIKNTGPKPIIAGFSTGEKYPYDIPGALAKIEIYKELETGQEWYFSQNVQNQIYSVKNDWTKTKPAWFFSSFFYENGEPTTDKIEVVDRPNGLEITQEKETHRFFKKSNPGKNIVIEFTTRGEHQEASFKVIEKNGLDIKPDYAMVSCFDMKQGKILCNLSEGYVDSKYYRPK